MMTDRKLNTREEADARYKWAIEDLYKDDEDWKRDYELLKSRIPELTKFRGRLGESAEVLLSMQKLSDELNQLLEKVYVYANQRLHENTDNSTYQNLASQAQGLLVELSESLLWSQSSWSCRTESLRHSWMKMKSFWYTASILKI